jgi:hypothetical protein
MGMVGGRWEVGGRDRDRHKEGGCLKGESRKSYGMKIACNQPSEPCQASNTHPVTLSRAFSYATELSVKRA